MFSKNLGSNLSRIIGITNKQTSLLRLTSASSSSSLSFLLPPTQKLSTKATEKNNINNDYKQKTAILMLNMGGPKTLDQVQPFLSRLFADRDIIQLPFQSILGPMIAQRRAPAVAEKYAEIGGGSPILDWTNRQGTAVISQLSQYYPSASFRHYVGFRYADPLLENTLKDIEREKFDRVIAFSQYAQYCCNTTGSSLNQLYRYFSHYYGSDAGRPPFHLSIIDRWPTNSGLIDCFKQLIQQEIDQLQPEVRSQAIILFTAHSLPSTSVDNGDTYTTEVAATVTAVMNSLEHKYPYRIVWQSKVGPKRWQGPATDAAIEGYAKAGFKHLILVPISFVNEHIETLHELDIEYCHDLAKKLPIESIRRCPAPNDHPSFISGMVQEVRKHIDSNQQFSPQLLTPCPLCDKQICSDARNWLKQLQQ